jgi:hypothetical protein
MSKGAPLPDLFFVGTSLAALVGPMTPSHCMAARAFLGLSPVLLAAQARVPISSLVRFEQGEVMPPFDDIAAIDRYLRSRGVMFLYSRGREPAGVWVEVAQPTRPKHAEE